MTKPYAIVNAGNVVSGMTIWDGTGSWAPPAGSQAIDCSAVDPLPGPGWSYNSITKAFAPPAPPTPTPPPVAATAEIVGQSFASGLRRQADALQTKGQYAAATALYLKAAGVPQS